MIHGDAFKDALPHLLHFACQVSLAITEFNQGHSLSACFYELALEQLAIKVNPGAAVLPRDWLATGIISKQSCVDPTHEQGSKLNPSSIQFLNLEFLKLIWFIKLGRHSLCKEGVKFMAMQDSATRPLNHVSEYAAHEQQVGGDISWVEHTGCV